LLSLLYLYPFEFLNSSMKFSWPPILAQSSKFKANRLILNLNNTCSKFVPLIVSMSFPSAKHILYVSPHLQISTIHNKSPNPHSKCPFPIHENRHKEDGKHVDIAQMSISSMTLCSLTNILIKYPSNHHKLHIEVWTPDFQCTITSIQREDSWIQIIPNWDEWH